MFKKPRITMLGLLLITTIFLVSCSQTQPVITGTLDPWTEDTPITGRHLALCEMSSAEKICACTLMKSSVTSDEQGEFEFRDAPAGEYMLIYDSGLSDFDDAMEKWGDTELRFCDPNWLSTYFGNYAEGWAKIHIPTGVNVGSGNEMNYAQFSLGLGNSPFILAHILGERPSNDAVLQPVVIEVTEGETNQIVVPIVYYGNK
jgi:hypothetical protein